MIICDKCKKNKAEYFLSIGYRADKNFQQYDLCEHDYQRFYEFFNSGESQSNQPKPQGKKISL
jgi:hypothetical protein